MPRKRVRLEEPVRSKRARLTSEIPSWEEVETWVISASQRNLWRCQPFYDLADLIQEAALRYVNCYELYWASERTHFISRFRAAVRNRFHDLATTRTKHSDVQVVEPHSDDLEVLDDSGMEAEERVLFADLMEQAPPRVQRFYRLVEGSADLDRFMRRRRRGLREPTATRIARILQIPREEAKDVRRELESFVRKLSEVGQVPVSS